ncbi:hypothetical protein SORBI_3002G229500, partial [Sorghum bicolor]
YVFWQLISYLPKIICTKEDEEVIRYMKTKSDKHVAVQIEECYGERQDMDCLFVEGEHVNGSVFLPINIPLCHWYLAVVNTLKRKIQVLDSFGMEMMDSIGMQMIECVDVRNTVQHNIFLMYTYFFKLLN